MTDNDEFINNIITAIKHREWDKIQSALAKILIQVPEEAPAYQDIFNILLMAITLSHPNTKTLYSDSKDLPSKMIKCVKNLRNG